MYVMKRRHVSFKARDVEPAGSYHMGVSRKMGDPEHSWTVYIGKSEDTVDDLGVPPGHSPGQLHLIPHLLGLYIIRL